MCTCRHGRSFLDHLDLELAIDEAEEVYQQQQQARAAAASAKRADAQWDDVQRMKPRHKQQAPMMADRTATSPALQTGPALDNTEEQQRQQQQQQQLASDAPTDLQTPGQALDHRTLLSRSNGHVAAEVPIQSARPSANDSAEPHASPADASSPGITTSSQDASASSAVPSHLESSASCSPQQQAVSSASDEGVSPSSPQEGTSPAVPQQGSAAPGPQPHWADSGALYFAVNADGEPLNITISPSDGQQAQELQCMPVFQVSFHSKPEDPAG